MRNKLLSKQDPISHNVITDAGHFVTQRFGCQARIGLGNLAVIVTSEWFMIPAPQLSGFSKRPTQVAIAVLAITDPFAFTIR